MNTASGPSCCIIVNLCIRCLQVFDICRNRTAIALRTVIVHIHIRQADLYAHLSHGMDGAAAVITKTFCCGLVSFKYCAILQRYRTFFRLRQANCHCAAAARCGIADKFCLVKSSVKYRTFAIIHVNGSAEGLRSILPELHI